MGVFDKLISTIDSVATNAIVGGNEVNSAVEKQDSLELKKLNDQAEVIKQELDASYAQIGRKYVDFIKLNPNEGCINIIDILKFMNPKMEQLDEIKRQIVALEKRMKDSAILREKQQIEQEFLAEKEKLDKALAMDVLTQNEYDQRISIIKKKVDNFEEIRRIEKQYEMNLINNDEKQARINALLVG